jgi:O-antigen ligase
MRETLKTKLKTLWQFIIPPGADKSEKFFSLLNFTIPFLMGFYIFINPLSMATFMEISYYLSILALIVLLVFRKTDFTLRSPLTLGLTLFSLWAVLGLFITLDFSNTLHDLRGYLLEYLIILYLLINYYNSRDRLEMLSFLVVVSTTIFSVGGIILYYFIEGHFFHERFGLTFKEMYCGFMCFTTIFAATLSLRGVYRAGSIARQTAYFVCFLILSTATLLNQSRGAILGLFAALVIMCLHRKKNIILIAATITMIILLPGLTDRIDERGGFTQDIRTKMFHLSWEVIKDYPIAGVGYGGEIYGNNKLMDLAKYNARLPEKYQQKKEYQGKLVIITSTHNTFLDIAIRTGLVGFTLFCFVVLTAMWMLWDVVRRRKEEFFRSWSICLFACLASYMVFALFADALYGAQGRIMYIILAMITILWNVSRSGQPASLNA